FTIGGYPNTGVYDSANGYLYFSNGGSGNVTVINGSSIVATIPVAPQSSGEVYDPTNGYVYVSNSNKVAVINGTEVVATIPVGTAPGPPIWNSRDGFVYVANSGSNNTSVINGTRVIASLMVSAEPQVAAFDTTTGYVYVANYGGTLSALYGTTVAATIPISSYVGPVTGLDYNRETGYLYVPDWWDGVVVVVNNTQVVARIVAPALQQGWYASVGYDDKSAYMYVVGANLGLGPRNSTASVIAGTTLVASFNINGSEPGYPVCDNATGLIYVSNVFSTY